MGDQYKIRFVRIKISSERTARLEAKEPLCLIREEPNNSLDLGHFIIVLGDPGSSGLSSGLGKFFRWFSEQQFWKIHHCTSLPLSLKTIHSEAGHCKLRITSSLFLALHCSEALHNKSLKHFRSPCSDYTSMSAF